MHFPDEINNFSKGKNKNRLKAIWNWLFEESAIRIWIIYIILLILNFIIWGFYLWVN